MTASKIMVIRHAEKPGDAGTVFGVSAEGNQNPEALIVRGWQRAGALATFFAPQDGHFRGERIETPDVVFAGRVAHHGKSLSPQYTVGPLAEPIGHSEGDEQQLAAAAVAADGVVLISWHHETIPAIKDAFLDDHSAPGIGIRSGLILFGSLLGQDRLALRASCAASPCGRQTGPDRIDS